MFGGDMNDLMKKFQELSSNLQEQQSKLANEKVEVSVGGEMVKMTFNGKQELLSVDISKEVIDPEDPAMLQDLILSAVNEGIRQSQNIAQELLGKSLPNIPGMTPPGFN